ncbi:MAG: formylmethanofuran dehydrogenase [Chloroflexi bacterium RBG_16_50_9]|nr:MAG: formylmethanofuran dehydrogenase [Chloroflexi bacterium RBG_16_50_9]
MSDYEFFLDKVGQSHGHVCTGIALGTKMTLAAMRFLGLDPHKKSRDIIAYVEIDRCMTDAVQVITGCSLGRRTLKHVDYGKFAMTLVNLTTGKAVRTLVKQKFNQEGSVEETIKNIGAIPDNELVTLQEVLVKIPETDLPGSPRKVAICSECGERIADGRECNKGGTILCKACADGAYYITN